MPHEAKNLIRDPAEWARDWGWVSRRRATNIAARIENVALVIEGALYGDEGAEMWAKELREIAKTLAPPMTPAEKRIAAMRER